MPDLYFQDGATLRTLTDLPVQQGATLKSGLREAWFQDGTNLRQVFGGAYVAMTGTLADVTGSGTGTGTLTVGSVTAQVQGGNASKSYAWSVTGSGFSVVPNGASCTVKQSYVGYSTYTGTLTCVVTDGTGSLTLTSTVRFTRSSSYVSMTGTLANVSGSGSGAGTLSVGTASINVSGGDAPYSYAWSITSGSNFVLTPNGDHCAISQTDSAAGDYSETLTCTVTDASSHVMTRTCTVSMDRSAEYVPMSGGISPSSLNGSAEEDTMPPLVTFFTVGTTSMDIVGGDDPITFAWSITGGLHFGTFGSMTTSTDQAPEVTAPNDAGTYSGTATCTATDASGHTLTDAIPVSFTVTASYTAMTGSMVNVSGSSVFSGNTNIGTATATVNGGNASKTYTFTKLSGDTAHFAISPSGNSCAVTANRARFDTADYSMTLRCVVDDGTDTLTLDCTVTDNYTM